MNKQNVKPYITPTVMSVEFKVEVGQQLSATANNLTGSDTWTLTTSSQPSSGTNNEQRSTSDFFEYDW